MCSIVCRARHLFCWCCEWWVYVVIWAGVSEGTKKSGIGTLGYLFSFTRVLFEFVTFWRQGNDNVEAIGSWV